MVAHQSQEQAMKMAQHRMLDSRANTCLTNYDRQSRAWSHIFKSSFLQGDFDYILLRASMVIVFLFFGYTKWHLYAVPILTPIIRNSPVLWPLYHEFGIRATLRFLGAAEWIIGVLLFSGFWDKRIGLLGAIGAAATFATTVTIIPFTPGGWAESAGGFPAMAGDVPFLMKDIFLFAASVYLVKQDALQLLGECPNGGPLNLVVKAAVALLAKCRFIEYDIEYYLLRASLVIIFFFFGYEK